MFTDATHKEIDETVLASWQAFQTFKKTTLAQRAALLRAIAANLEAAGDDLIDAAFTETNLQKGRLMVELKRTLYQLTSYADACEKGHWLDIRIDTADPNRQPPKPDVRKMMVPLGPVVVFGASNFPFAYSTAGGDSACALAAGCTVIIKGHPAHARTSHMAAAAVQQALLSQGLPEAAFLHLHGSTFAVGEALVKHPKVKAVGFTGSLAGGRALFNLAAAREEPIPVFAEMGSVNPVFILPQKLAADMPAIVDMYAASITTSGGQFCTNPGLLFGVASPELDLLMRLLGERLAATAPEKMLHQGIAQSFRQKRSEMIASGLVSVVGTNETGGDAESIPTLATTSGTDFLANPLLHQEVFGPYSLIVACSGTDQLTQIAMELEGQLTATLMATPEEAVANPNLVVALQSFCGRMVFNGVPTGVEVCLAMNHGGPYPATTDSRFTAVGADGIKRFARPVSFQNFPDSLLPTELQNSNPLHLWRTINNKPTQDGI